MTNYDNNLGNCNPIQILNINEPIKSIEDIQIFKCENEQYQTCELQYAYSLDTLCYSCYMDYENALKNTLDLNTDFFVRIQVQGSINSVKIKDESGNWYQAFNWSSSIKDGFNFVACDGNINNQSANMYNPYANMDCAIGLQQQLSETVACMFGIPVYYFKVSGVKDSADITFKEYALKHVTSVKQIKIVVADGKMPSSKPEFNDFGIDWQSDWEVEVTKGMFATAFGNKEQPTEGDFIYIPMMKRMWMVNEAYEEKNESLMWIATTFKLALVKYQDDTMVDKSDTEDIVNDIVKNKYEDLFGDQEGLDSGVEATEPIEALPNNMQPVFETDACRKYVNVTETDIKNINQNTALKAIYQKGTLIADSFYQFNNTAQNNALRIEYQRMFCGDELTLSFMINPSSTLANNASNKDNVLISIGHIKLYYNIGMSQDNKPVFCIYNINNKKLKVELEELDNFYFVVFRFSKSMNTSDISAFKYSYPSNIPLYKLQKYHYYIDIGNGQTISSNYTNEFNVNSKSAVRIFDIPNSYITNIKLFDMYMDNMSEIMMQYPTNQHLLINDTARPLYGLLGIKNM